VKFLREIFYCTYATSYTHPHLSHSCPHTYDYFPLCLLHGGTKGLTTHTHTHTYAPSSTIHKSPQKIFCFDSISYCLLHGGTKDLTTQHSQALRPLLHTHTYATSSPIQKTQNKKHVSTRFQAAFFTVAQRA
jgi:hypothetical protein